MPKAAVSQDACVKVKALSYRCQAVPEEEPGERVCLILGSSRSNRLPRKGTVDAPCPVQADRYHMEGRGRAASR